MTSDDTTTQTSVTGPVTGPRHAYQPSGQPDDCAHCMQPFEAADHPHRFEPTLAYPSECMCGDLADAPQHQPAGTIRTDRDLTEADYAAIAARFAQVQRTHQPMVVSPPVQVTGRDDGPPTPLLLAQRSGSRYAAIRTAIRARLGKATR